MGNGEAPLRGIKTNQSNKLNINAKTMFYLQKNLLLFLVGVPGAGAGAGAGGHAANLIDVEEGGAGGDAGPLSQSRDLRP
jgi:hypothetical protein